MAIAPAATEAGPAQAEAQGPAERRQPPARGRASSFSASRGCVEDRIT